MDESPKVKREKTKRSSKGGVVADCEKTRRQPTKQTSDSVSTIGLPSAVGEDSRKKKKKRADTEGSELKVDLKNSYEKEGKSAGTNRKSTSKFIPKDSGDEETLPPPPGKSPKRLKVKKRKESNYGAAAQDGDSEMVDTEEGGGPDAAKEALQYLHLWDKDRAGWKFQKVRQTWLLQHLYDTSAVEAVDFTCLLRYLQGMKGMAAATTLSKATKVANDEEAGESKRQRATDIIQVVEDSNE